MTARLIRLLTLLALVWMPIGMANARTPAAAHASADHHMRMCDEGTCEEQAPDPRALADCLSDCALACAMVLTQAARIQDSAMLRVPSPNWAGSREPPTRRPETDPPPPKFA